MYPVNASRGGTYLDGINYVAFSDEHAQIDKRWVWNGKEYEEDASFRPSPADGTRYRMGVEDSDYLEAVNDGDTQAARRMVQDAALEAGAMEDSDGYPFMLYHGSPNTFNVFNEGGGLIWATPERFYASKYGDVRMPLYAFPEKVLDVGEINSPLRNGDGSPSDGAVALAEKLGVSAKTIVELGLENDNASHKDELWAVTSAQGFRKLLEDAGYDMVMATEGDVLTFGVLRSSQYKSADAVTRDDAGNVIPLSERFSGSSDVRYRLGNEGGPEAQMGGVGSFDIEGSLGHTKNMPNGTQSGKEGIYGNDNGTWTTGNVPGRSPSFETARNRNEGDGVFVHEGSMAPDGGQKGYSKYLGREARVEDFKRFGFGSFDDRSSAGRTGKEGNAHEGESHLGALFDFLDAFRSALKIPSDAISLGGVLRLSLNRVEDGITQYAVRLFEDEYVNAIHGDHELIVPADGVLPSFAHEWFHAIDNLIPQGPEYRGFWEPKEGEGFHDMFARAEKALKSYLSLLKEKPISVRKETWDAFQNVMRAIAEHKEFLDASLFATPPSAENMSYWIDPKELGARAFEGFIRDKLKDIGLATYTDEDVELSVLPDPSNPDTRKVFDAFQDLFDTLKPYNRGDGRPSTLYRLGAAAPFNTNTGAAYRMGGPDLRAGLDAWMREMAQEREQARRADAADEASANGRPEALRSKGKKIYDWFRRKMINDQAPVFDAIRRVMGTRTAADAENVEAAAKNVHGRIMAGQQFIQHAFVDKITAILSEPGMDRALFDEYLYALFAPERNRQILERTAKEDPMTGELVGDKNGSGMSDERARQIIARVEADPKAERYKAAAELVHKMNRRTAWMMAEYGFVEKGQVAAWFAQSPHYVPLKDAQAKAWSLRHSVGRFDEADSPLVNSIRQAYETVRNGELNGVNRTMAAWLRKYDPTGASLGGRVEDSPGETRRVREGKPEFIRFGTPAYEELRAAGVRMRPTEDGKGVLVDTGHLPRALRVVSIVYAPSEAGAVSFARRAYAAMSARAAEAEAEASAAEADTPANLTRSAAARNAERASRSA